MRTGLTFHNKRSLQTDCDVVRSGQRLVLDEHYVLEQRLGRGGMGDVWAAHRERDGQPVAIKILHPHLLDLVGRVEREAEVLMRLPEGCAPSLFAYGCSENGEICLVMERLYGEDLARRLTRPHVMPVWEALTIVTGIAHVLDQAHDMGIVHRDLKPSNVFLCESSHSVFTLRVLDFGIAHLTTASMNEPLTHDGEFVGSPGYLAPEQVLDMDCEIGPHTDVFGLAALAYRLFTGHPAFRCRSYAEAAFQAAYSQPARASGVREDLPESLDEVLGQALSKSPSERPARAGALAAALADALASTDDAPTLVRPTTQAAFRCTDVARDRGRAAS
ncbi:serine/threonine protein kinase [Pendulispora brunnea]|uniref:Serine/threonine protein kinase n=1 Tax=Pendulispora brunnea TaxID=2905690 RepID=A0ABZ2K5N8_9BACT